jgi:signal transduction histidine kinase/CheY-like chemotaxis protein
MEDEIAPIVIETTQTLDTMLHQILNQALVAIGANAGSLMLVDVKQGILQIKARLGAPQPGRKSERVFRIDDNSIAGHVVRTRSSYLCSSVDTDIHFLPSRSGDNFASVLAVPIVKGERVLAVINADAQEPGYFTAKRQQQLEDVARLVADPVAERISVIAALAEVGVELTRLPNRGGVERVLEKIAELAVRSLGADVVTVYQYDEATGDFPVEGSGPTVGGEISDPSPMRRKVHVDDVPWRVVNERRSGFYADVQREDFLGGEIQRPGEAPRPRFIAREGIRSMAALLLPFRAAEQGEEEVVGVMFANYRTPHTFNIDETTALATFADYAAVAILNARHEEQRRADQLKLVESVSANFAHRMSNLAGPSRGAVQLLRERIDAADTIAHRQLNTIQREADVLLALADRLVRRFREADRTPDSSSIRVQELLRQESDRIRESYPHLEVTLEIDETLPPVQSMDFQLRQVLYDIMKNAAEAIGDQLGTVTVRAMFNSTRSNVDVEISDTGGGIPDHLQSRLFSAGTTTKKESLGVGLWYSRTFLQATGGDIIVKQTGPDEGTTMLVQVPCLDASGAMAARVSGTERSEVDVLIVDDDVDWRQVLQDSLLTGGHSVRTAASYGEASDALATRHFTLVVLDVHLAAGDETNRDGLRLFAELRQLADPPSVIFVTKDPDEIDRTQDENVICTIAKTEFDVAAFRRMASLILGSERSSGGPA